MDGYLARGILGSKCLAHTENARRKKEIPYIEGKIKDIGARVGYTVL